MYSRLMLVIVVMGILPTDGTLKDCNHNEFTIVSTTEPQKNEVNTRDINQLKEELSQIFEEKIHKLISQIFEEKIYKLQENISEIRNQLSTEKQLNHELVQKIAVIQTELKNGQKVKNEQTPKDCLEIFETDDHGSGIYFIQPHSKKFRVLCDMTTRGDGWTVIQNRFDGSQDFNLGWLDYKYGFGQISGEFWLGLEHIHQLTENEPSELMVQLEDKNHTKAYAYYRSFGVGNEYDKYKIKLLDGYEGDAGDSLAFHLDKSFSTKDHQPVYCTRTYGGGWWFGEDSDLLCLRSNLNGRYLHASLYGTKRGSGINWYSFSTDYTSLIAAKMMVRRRTSL